METSEDNLNNDTGALRVKILSHNKNKKQRKDGNAFGWRSWVEVRK